MQIAWNVHNSSLFINLVAKCRRYVALHVTFMLFKIYQTTRCLRGAFVISLVWGHLKRQTQRLYQQHNHWGMPLSLKVWPGDSLTIK